MGIWTGEIKKLDDYRWEVPRSGPMRVPGIIYATEKLLEAIKADNAVEQVANVACLPGIVRASIAMPDAHWGYGFPIGGVAAFSVEEGVISPGGVGYDINCGVRLLRTAVPASEVLPRLAELCATLGARVPSGVGSKSATRLSRKDLTSILREGARWAVKHGFGEESDLERTEEGGAMEGADPDAVSEKAYERGGPQQGTLGSGNHFVEVQKVAEVFDEAAARAFGLEVGMLAVSIHSGSRGLGHQVCTDHLKEMGRAATRYGIELPDRQLACAPLSSPEGRAYFGAMAAAANYAWCNRQMLAHAVKEALAVFFGAGPEALGIGTVYDVAHNIAKLETHAVDGRSVRLCVHRKGATRAFPAGHPEVPRPYASVGQPVLVPGDMGTASWVLVGEPAAMEECFGSACHGAGRALSRHAACQQARGRDIAGELRQKGIYVTAASRSTIAEEMPEAYKDVDEVVGVMVAAGLARRVARLVPLAVVKG